MKKSTITGRKSIAMGGSKGTKKPGGKGRKGC